MQHACPSHNTSAKSFKDKTGWDELPNVLGLSEGGAAWSGCEHFCGEAVPCGFATATFCLSMLRPVQSMLCTATLSLFPDTSFVALPEIFPMWKSCGYVHGATEMFHECGTKQEADELMKLLNNFSWMWPLLDTSPSSFSKPGWTPSKAKLLRSMSYWVFKILKDVDSHSLAGQPVPLCSKSSFCVSVCVNAEKGGDRRTREYTQRLVCAYSCTELCSQILFLFWQVERAHCHWQPGQ